MRINTLLLHTFSPHIHIHIVSVADDQSLTRTCSQSYHWYGHLNCAGFFRTHWTRTCAYYNDISALFIELHVTVALNLIHTHNMIII